MKATEERTSTGASAQMRGAPQQPDRTGDRLLQLPEISERTTLTEATLRWQRHKGEAPFIFKLGRRLVAWESEVLAWIAEQREKDAKAR